MTLRDRCREFLDRARRDAILRQGDPVGSLEGFVMTERGRAAAPALEEAAPLILYFSNAADRDEFMALIREAKPGLMMQKMP